MTEPCQTCLDYEERMRKTPSDAEWNEIYMKLEQHQYEAHLLGEKEVEEEESTEEGFHD